VVYFAAGLHLVANELKKEGWVPWIGLPKHTANDKTRKKRNPSKTRDSIFVEIVSTRVLTSLNRYIYLSSEKLQGQRSQLSQCWDAYEMVYCSRSRLTSVSKLAVGVKSPTCKVGSKEENHREFLVQPQRNKFWSSRIATQPGHSLQCRSCLIVFPLANFTL